MSHTLHCSVTVGVVTVPWESNEGFVAQVCVMRIQVTPDGITMFSSCEGEKTVESEQETQNCYRIALIQSSKKELHIPPAY